jgi:hypothetical protein
MAAAALALSDLDRATLEAWTRASRVSAGQRERALIVLAIADGASVSGAARSLSVSRPTVIKWRDRFVADGLGGLGDLPRSGRPKTIDDAQIIAATLEPPPKSLAVTHWSSRLLGRYLGIGDATVARAWRAYRVQPWRQGTFKFSTDPELEAKVRDVVGLYLDPPQNAIVLCVDEKSQIQALNRTQPILPVRPGLPERATHEVLSDEVCGVGMTDTALGAGKAIRDRHDQEVEKEILFQARSLRECRGGGPRSARWTAA